MGTQSAGTVQKTRLMLSSALMRLLEKRSFRKISVGDICQEALVSRSAFYVHFADKYELLRFCMEEMLLKQEEAGRGRTLEAQMMIMLENVRSHRRMLHNILLADLSQEILLIFQRTLDEFVAMRLQRMERDGVQLPGPIPMLTAFCAGGLANMMICWLQDNCAQPMEEAARCQCELIRRILGDTANLPEDRAEKGEAECLRGRQPS